MTTKTLLDGAGASFSGDFNLLLGRQSAANTRSFNLSTEDLAAVNAITTALGGTLTVTANVGTGTQPISASSLPLPTGAATAANQTALTALFPTSLGTKTAANSLAVTLASDGTFVTSIGAPSDAAWTTGNGTQIALLKAIAGAAVDTATASPVRDANAGEYEFVAASATTQAIGATGAVGDWFSHIVIIPATTSPGAVAIKDGSGTAMTIFAGGASSVTSLAPITVALDLKSVNGAWQVTTGTNVSAIAAGNFT